MEKYKTHIATDKDVCCDFFSGEASKKRPWIKDFILKKEETLYLEKTNLEQVVMESLLHSKRIPKFVEEHQCRVFFSASYGQSEAGSSSTMPCPDESIRDCSYGILMPATVISAFDKDGYITEKGLLHVLGWNLKKRVEDTYLFELVMENRVCDVPRIEYIFFVVVSDQKNPGYYLPYAYVQLKDAGDLEDVRRKIYCSA